MRLPYLNEIPTSRRTIDSFGGYNHSHATAEYEFHDMLNMSTRNFPSLSPRLPRGTPTRSTGYTINGFAVVRVDDKGAVAMKRLNPSYNIYDLFDYDESRDPRENFIGTMYYYTANQAGQFVPDQLVVSGANVISWETGKTESLRYLDTTVARTQPGSGNPDSIPFNATWVQGNGDTIRFDPCDAEGNIISGITVADTAPTNPSNGAYWIDSSVDQWTDTSGSVTSTGNTSLQRYSSSQQSWVIVPALYLKLASPNIAANFSEGDVVQITNRDRLEGYPARAIRGYHLIEKLHHDANHPENDYIVIIGQAASTGSDWPAPDRPDSDLNVYLFRTAPNMDYITESGNRLWGCRFGTNVKGDFVNEIYASALGDVKNWNKFTGISTDSYTASVGADGAFTGAITYQGKPTFFKENFVLRVYGTEPSNFQIQTSSIMGVQKGSWKSLAIVDDILYYKSVNGICMYDGSVPVEITNIFGDVKYHDAVGCGHNGKYYVCMKDESNTPHLFVYDTKKRVWTHEDNIEVKDFCSVGNVLYFIDGDNVLRTIEGNDDETVEWMLETGDIGLTFSDSPMPDEKYVSRLLIRMAMTDGSRADIYTKYDSIGEWKHATALTGRRLKSYNVPIRPHRCDHMRIKITGKGDVRIQSITKTFEQGSDIF